MRSQVHLRSAKDSDAGSLVAVWEGVLRRGSREQQVEDVREVIGRASAASEERIVVAEVDDRVVGAVHLRATTISPINLEPVVRAISPHVLDGHRRHGVGSALMDAAVSFAEERGIGHVGTAVDHGAREANRFMARLALGPTALLRVAPTSTVKSRLRLAGHTGRIPGRPLSQVLAARRSMRRMPTR